LLKSEWAGHIQRAARGDLEAFRSIHQEYGKRILNFIYRMVASREDAEDLTQNVFLIAFHELGKLQDPERFESWLFRIARNEVYQEFRRKRSDPKVFESTSFGDSDDEPEIEIRDKRSTPQQKLLQSELGTQIQEVLASLPSKLREVFVLAVIQEKSYAEIAEIVGRSLLAVKTDIFRARAIARKSLGKYLEAHK
jgi:RNA polymerase sigma-70 factor, ECF subfamily